MISSLRPHLIRALIIGELYFVLIAITLYLADFTLPNMPLAEGVLYVSAAILFPALAGLSIVVGQVGTKYIQSLLQIVKFALVGVLNTLVDLGLFTILTVIFPGVGLFVALLFKTISFLAAVTNSYLWNKLWVFDAATKTNDTVNTLKEFTSFLIVSVGGLLINLFAFAASVFLISSLFEMSTLLVQVSAALIASISALVWNFLGYKIIVFKK